MVLHSLHCYYYYSSSFLFPRLVVALTSVEINQQKPMVVFFGENVPKETVKEAMDLTLSSDGVLVIGSSLMVYSGISYKPQERERILDVINTWNRENFFFMYVIYMVCVKIRKNWERERERSHSLESQLTGSWRRQRSMASLLHWSTLGPLVPTSSLLSMSRCKRDPPSCCHNCYPSSGLELDHQMLHSYENTIERTHVYTYTCTFLSVEHVVRNAIPSSTCCLFIIIIYTDISSLKSLLSLSLSLFHFSCSCSFSFCSSFLPSFLRHNSNSLFVWTHNGVSVLCLLGCLRVCLWSMRCRAVCHVAATGLGFPLSGLEGLCCFHFPEASFFVEFARGLHFTVLQ